MAFRLLTAMGSDFPEQNEIRSYGPLPTPKEPLLTLGFCLTLKPGNTVDQRIAQFGRIIVFWIITRSYSIMRYVGVIKKLLERSLQIYGIQTDTDLDTETMKKIDERIQIIDTRIESYYVSPRGKVEPMSHISLISADAPIILVDHSNKQIKALIRKEYTPGQKSKVLQSINDFKQEFKQGIMFKVEMISEPFEIQRVLTKFGIEAPSQNGIHFRIKLDDSLITFEDLDAFFEQKLTPRRQDVVKFALKSLQNRREISIDALSRQSGLTPELLMHLFLDAKEAGLLPQITIENNLVFLKTAGDDD
ncbi:MAG: hypothetical protein ACFFFG_00045 [Candidatus Thorarchaeota archaeon]